MSIIDEACLPREGANEGEMQGVSYSLYDYEAACEECSSAYPGLNYSEFYDEDTFSRKDIRLYRMFFYTEKECLDPSIE